jgi:hypothetical protein
MTGLRGLRVNPEEDIDARDKAVILYFGDHDPSVLDIIRHIRERLWQLGITADLRHIALVREQIEEHNLPPQPAKHTDARTFGYSLEHGDEAWELDALEPDDLQQIIRDSVAEYYDKNTYERVKEKQAEVRTRLKEMVVEALREAAGEGEVRDHALPCVYASAHVILHGRDALDGLMRYRTFLKCITVAAESRCGLVTRVQVPLQTASHSSRG